MNTNDIPAWASAVALVIHALASAAVQVIRAWKQPVTTSGPPAPPPSNPPPTNQPK